MKITANDHAGLYTVLLDGEDVTGETLAADDGEGWVDTLVKDDQGRAMMDWNPVTNQPEEGRGIEILRKTGVVELVAK